MRAVLALTMLAALAGGLAASGQRDERCDLHFSGGAVLMAVPVAKTKSAQSAGLSNRDDAGSGMLFSWSSAEPRVFWMRDTRMPLSIAFIDSAGVVFDIQNMAPMTDTYHFSLAPAQHALELAQGQFEAQGIRVGDRMTRQVCRSED